jgi:galactokinase/mevalonate kinase-like predicted kinase
VFRWERGQRLDQTLVDLQLPLAERLLEKTGDDTHTMILSGDALVVSPPYTGDLPEADVLLIAVPADPSVAMNHGVFVCDREKPDQLIRMLQKPSRNELQQVTLKHMFFIDTGMWILSDRAVEVLMSKTGWDAPAQSFAQKIPDFYDLYGTMGAGLGIHPLEADEALQALSVAVVPLTGGTFHHFGTSGEIISSALELQNMVTDQRLIWSKNIKPHPSIFTQNARVASPLSEHLHQVWIENSHIPVSWKLHGRHVLTGIPENAWDLDLPEGICLDLIPVGTQEWVVRPYGIDDTFRGCVTDEQTIWMGQSLQSWFANRSLEAPSTTDDIQEFPLFPVLQPQDLNSSVIQWMIDSNPTDSKITELYTSCRKVSASELLQLVNLKRLTTQREQNRKENYIHLGKNYNKSVFHQIDLRHAAKKIDKQILNLIPEPDRKSEPFAAMHDSMLRSEVLGDTDYEQNAFAILQESIIAPVRQRKVVPECVVYPDQIVWARSPVRIDLAGGWTDTPPHSLLNGGDVVTVALELNGQPPLQAYIRPVQKRSITLRSIDQGSETVINEFSDLSVLNNLHSGFSIPKAALCLAGFHPDFCGKQYPSLKAQLADMGSGFELTFFSAVPRGSGLGTSSILSATILGALSDFCGLGWDLHEIGDRCLALEQMLTSGGGWQDQYGGLFPGLKLLHTDRGLNQKPHVKWLPETLFSHPEYKDCMVLYYTGITRIAKDLLGQIVKGMFLNDAHDSLVLREMKHHAIETAEIIQRNDFQEFGKAINRTWQLKNRLDSDTNNPEIQRIIDLIDDYALGYILPGAGGGGYLFIVGKDIEATNIIRTRLEQNRGSANARVVGMEISRSGFQLSRN